MNPTYEEYKEHVLSERARIKEEMESEDIYDYYYDDDEFDETDIMLDYYTCMDDEDNVIRIQMGLDPI